MTMLNRPRRMRESSFSRTLMRENNISVSNLIYPMFVIEGTGVRQDIESMPGIQRLSIDELIKDASECYKFGIPAILGAYAGARLLSLLSTSDQVIHLLGFETSGLNLVLGGLILLFALMELLPRLKDVQLSAKWLFPGGVISGFFGGLSGHQGALRSAFLVKLKLSKEQFVATGVVIACIVDTIRISTYATNFDMERIASMRPLLIMATLAAFGGALLGKYLLKKITIGLIQNIVGILMIIISILLFLGLI